MAKAVYRPEELEPVDQMIVLDPPTAFAELAHLMPVDEEENEVSEEVDVYTGPTADDLRREAETFKEQWDLERMAMIQSAKAEADRIIKQAENSAAAKAEQADFDAEASKSKAEEEAERIIAEAGDKGKQIEEEFQAAVAAKQKEAEDEGRAAGREEGFAEGKAELDRLIARTRVMLERAQDLRGDILLETEQEIVDLVLLIARKVVKTISENQRSVVVSNIVQALRKIKTRGNILIRVNLADLKLSTEHLENFIKVVEGSKIQLLEDSSVDPGGCIIETDFGEIDARISSQLAELETKILEITPITAKQKVKAAPKAQGS